MDKDERQGLLGVLDYFEMSAACWHAKALSDGLSMEMSYAAGKYRAFEHAAELLHAALFPDLVFPARTHQPVDVSSIRSSVTFD